MGQLFDLIVGERIQEEQMVQIGVLEALGYTSRELSLSYICEYVLTGGIGAIIGGNATTGGSFFTLAALDSAKRVTSAIIDITTIRIRRISTSVCTSRLIIPLVRVSMTVEKAAAVMPPMIAPMPPVRLTISAPI